MSCLRVVVNEIHFVKFVVVLALKILMLLLNYTIEAVFIGVAMPFVMFMITTAILHDNLVVIQFPLKLLRIFSS